MNVRLMITGTIVVLIHVILLAILIGSLRRDATPVPKGSTPADQTDYQVLAPGQAAPSGQAPSPAAQPLRPVDVSPAPVTTRASNDSSGPPIRPTTQRPANVQPAEPTGESRFHVVKPGDSFWRISKQYNVTMDDLLHANNFKKTDTLQVGVRLVIPPSS